MAIYLKTPPGYPSTLSGLEICVNTGSERLNECPQCRQFVWVMEQARVLQSQITFSSALDCMRGSQGGSRNDEVGLLASYSRMSSGRTKARGNSAKVWLQCGKRTPGGSVAPCGSEAL